MILFLDSQRSWIQALAKRCDTIHVITMKQGRLELPDNVKVYSVGKEKGYSEPRRAIEFYRYLIRILANNHIDACFAHMMPLFAVMGAPLLKIKHIPIVLWYAHVYASPQLRLAERLVNKIVTSTPGGCGLNSKKVNVIGHGVDTMQFYCENKKPFASSKHIELLYVGRITPIKHIETLIEAVGHLYYNSGITDINVHLIGDIGIDSDKDYYNQIKKRIIELELGKHIYFEGPVRHSELPKWYCSADAVYNGTPKGIDKTALEAMACEVPIFASSEYFQSILGPHADQFIFPEGNYICLAEKILAFMDCCSSDLQAIRQRLRQIVVSEHNLDRLARILVEILQC